MNTRFETQVRCSPTGVATATILIVMLAMAASTVFPVDVPTAGPTAATGHSHMAQSHPTGQVKRS
jgi:hypothetical protein